MAKSAVETLVAKIDADISRLRDMREYLLSHTVTEAAAAPKTRKTRKKKGLPASDAAADTGI